MIRRQFFSDFNENHDPKSGQFSSGGGNSVAGSTSLGHGYSKEARLINGKIYTSNVYDAVRALYENKAVELSQPRQVSTVLDKLGAVSAKMVELGSKAP